MVKNISNPCCSLDPLWLKLCESLWMYKHAPFQNPSGYMKLQISGKWDTTTTSYPLETTELHSPHLQRVFSAQKKLQISACGLYWVWVSGWVWKQKTNKKNCDNSLKILKVMPFKELKSLEKPLWRWWCGSCKLGATQTQSTDMWNQGCGTHEYGGLPVHSY